MQTLERVEGAELGGPEPRRRRSVAAIVTGVVVLVAAAAGAYAVGSSKSSTKTIVKTVAVAPPTTAAPSCIPGAAPGSCNIDEAAQVAIPDKPLSAKTRATEAAELVLARAAAMRYPTVADALRAHMLQAGKFSPETGAHYINVGAMIPKAHPDRVGSFDVSNPGSYIYDGTSPTSKVIGVMYLALSIAPPEGFAGPNDHWHRHTNTCVEYKGGKIVIPFAADSSVTQTQCNKVHGQFMRETAWMLHAWVVPGWESPRGVFSHDNPDVLCADGSTKTDAVGFCRGT